MDANYRTANIVARTTLTGSEDVGRLVERIEARLDELPQRLRGRVTGDLVLLRHTADSISWGQLQSLGIALLTIYLTLALLLTSLPRRPLRADPERAADRDLLRRARPRGRAAQPRRPA